MPVENADVVARAAAAIALKLLEKHGGTYAVVDVNATIKTCVHVDELRALAGGARLVFTASRV